jgi:hypothetical protein
VELYSQLGQGEGRVHSAAADLSKIGTRCTSSAICAAPSSWKLTLYLENRNRSWVQGLSCIAAVVDWLYPTPANPQSHQALHNMLQPTCITCKGDSRWLHCTRQLTCALLHQTAANYQDNRTLAERRLFTQLPPTAATAAHASRMLPVCHAARPGSPYIQEWGYHTPAKSILLLMERTSHTNCCASPLYVRCASPMSRHTQPEWTAAHAIVYKQHTQLLQTAADSNNRALHTGCAACNIPNASMRRKGPQGTPCLHCTTAAHKQGCWQPKTSNCCQCDGLRRAGLRPPA